MFYVCKFVFMVIFYLSVNYVCYLEVMIFYIIFDVKKVIGKESLYFSVIGKWFKEWVVEVKVVRRVRDG